jgi:quercetin dioxygenase-like cupin family protein
MQKQDTSLLTVHPEEAGWLELIPKVHARRLHCDGAAESYLVRLDPGACLPAHVHPAEEECLVIEGEVCAGALRLRSGDFHLAHPGSRHAPMESAGGALLFMRIAQPLRNYFGIDWPGA